MYSLDRHLLTTRTNAFEDIRERSTSNLVGRVIAVDSHLLHGCRRLLLFYTLSGRRGTSSKSGDAKVSTHFERRD